MYFSIYYIKNHYFIRSCKIRFGLVSFDSSQTECLVWVPNKSRTLTTNCKQWWFNVVDEPFSTTDHVKCFTICVPNEIYSWYLCNGSITLTETHTENYYGTGLEMYSLPKPNPLTSIVTFLVSVAVSASVNEPNTDMVWQYTDYFQQLSKTSTENLGTCPISIWKLKIFKLPLYLPQNN